MVRDQAMRNCGCERMSLGSYGLSLGSKLRWISKLRINGKLSARELCIVRIVVVNSLYAFCSMIFSRAKYLNFGV